MEHEDQIAEMVDKLRHLLGNRDEERNFVAPSLLKEVPSITSSDSVPPWEAKGRAELGRRSI